MVLKWPPPVSSDSNGGIPVAASLLSNEGGAGGAEVPGQR